MYIAYCETAGMIIDWRTQHLADEGNPATFAYVLNTAALCIFFASNYAKTSLSTRMDRSRHTPTYVIIAGLLFVSTGKGPG